MHYTWWNLAWFPGNCFLRAKQFISTFLQLSFTEATRLFKRKDLTDVTKLSCFITQQIYSNFPSEISSRNFCCIHHNFWILRRGTASLSVHRTITFMVLPSTQTNNIFKIEPVTFWRDDVHHLTKDWEKVVKNDGEYVITS